MADEYVIDTLIKRTTGKKFYPNSLLKAIKESENENSKNLYDILINNGIPLNYELYGYAVCISNPNPQTRISCLEMARGKRPAFWNYTNGYFDYGDWSHSFFVENTFPCMVKYDGTIDYKLDPNNYNLKEDGTTSDVANAAYEGSAMVAFPTIWTKRWQDDNYLYCLICNKQLDSDFHAYMHTRADGSIAKYKFIAMYPSTLYADKYKSLAGTTITASQTFEKELLYTHNIGENWEVFSLSDWATLSDLLTLLPKSDNYQQSFGYGYVGASAVNTASDPGTTRYGGAFYNSAALNSNSYQKVFHIHQLFSNVGTRLGGLVYDTGVMYAKPYPPYNLTGEGYENIGLTITGSSGGYIKQCKMTDLGRLPLVLGGSATTYECDVATYSNTIIAIPYLRNAYSHGTAAGKLAFSADSVGTTTSNWIAPRLTCFSVDLTEGQEDVSTPTDSLMNQPRKMKS